MIQYLSQQLMQIVWRVGALLKGMAQPPAIQPPSQGEEKKQLKGKESRVTNFIFCVAHGVVSQDDVAGCFDYYAGLAEKLDERQNSAIDVGMDDFQVKVGDMNKAQAGSVLVFTVSYGQYACLCAGEDFVVSLLLATLKSPFLLLACVTICVVTNFLYDFLVFPCAGP